MNKLNVGNLAPIGVRNAFRPNPSGRDAKGLPRLRCRQSAGRFGKRPRDARVEGDVLISPAGSEDEQHLIWIVYKRFTVSVKEETALALTVISGSRACGYNHGSPTTGIAGIDQPVCTAEFLLDQKPEEKPRRFQ